MRALRVDITTLEVDAIVNAALRGGGGVDGAIHRAAGPALLAASLALGGCPSGEARITPGFRLRARHVIHAVGPVWQGGGAGEPELLAGCYRHAMALLHQASGRSIAFPAISTGVYGFPSALAASIAVVTVRRSLAEHGPAEVTFACFDTPMLALYEKELAA
jgi:O-acetyl-ADP-ribose deacetylase (regulator of RNase III)